MSIEKLVFIIVSLIIMFLAGVRLIISIDRIVDMVKLK